jgi:catechol-2,3-dioxygenase
LRHFGFEITQRYGNSAVFISAGGYHHHIGLNTWHSKGAEPAPVKAAGHYHLAILYPTRKDLAVAVQRLITENYHFPAQQTMGFLKPFTWQIPITMALNYIGINPGKNGRLTAMVG